MFIVALTKDCVITESVEMVFKGDGFFRVDLVLDKP